MLESKINLQKAMREGRSKEFVKEKFNKYIITYSKMKNPNKKDVKDYNELYSNYKEYMQEEVKGDDLSI
jgi:hypothetical protein